MFLPSTYQNLVKVTKVEVMNISAQGLYNEQGNTSLRVEVMIRMENKELSANMEEVKLNANKVIQDLPGVVSSSLKLNGKLVLGSDKVSLILLTMGGFLQTSVLLQI